MAQRVNREYNALKTFTENASHEMQTPLAIINSKLDLLIQGENINEQQMRQLHSIYNAIERLSKMTQSLLLLTKIENNQFSNTEKIMLDNTIKKKMLQFEELMAHKKLTVIADIHPLTIDCNSALLDILLSNLLNNAIRYSNENGILSVTLKNKILSVINSSDSIALDEQEVFKRFYRNTDNKQEGNGLGLSIIKEICNKAGYDVQYYYRELHHEFTIQF